jgi:hypothetical protein
MTKFKYLDEVLVIKKQTDPLAQKVGEPINSYYTDMFWLPILGPSSVAFLRICSWFLTQDDQFEIQTKTLSNYLGISLKILPKVIKRLMYFDAAFSSNIYNDTLSHLWIRTYLYPLNSALLSLLQPELLTHHQNYIAAKH